MTGDRSMYGDDLVLWDVIVLPLLNRVLQDLGADHGNLGSHVIKGNGGQSLVTNLRSPTCCKILKH